MSVGTTVSDQTSGRPSILTINGGSSSVKFALFDAADPSTRKLCGRIERIGQPESWLVVDNCDADAAEDGEVDVPDHAAAARLIIERLGKESILVVGHRIVHGGGKFQGPERVTPQLLDELRRICPYDPDHLPDEIALIEAFASSATSSTVSPISAALAPMPNRTSATG